MQGNKPGIVFALFAPLFKCKDKKKEGFLEMSLNAINKPLTVMHAIKRLEGFESRLLHETRLLCDAY